MQVGWKSEPKFNVACGSKSHEEFRANKNEDAQGTKNIDECIQEETKMPIFHISHAMWFKS